MTTPLLGLSEVSEGVVNQATIHNTALRQLEALLVRALSKDVAAPPAAVEGDSYIIPAGATGAWAGKTDQVAAFIGGAWSYFTVSEGVRLWINDLDAEYVFDGADWVANGGGVTDGDKGDITVAGGAWTIDSAVISTFGRTLTDDADAAAARTTLGLGTAATLAADTDTALAANSDTKVPTQKAVKAYVDAIATSGATDVMVFKGVIDCSSNPNFPAADAGNLYKVSVAGKIGGTSGTDVGAGDTIYCITDGSASGTLAVVGANWNIADANETTATAGALINSATAKTTPVDADYMGLMDSAASNVLKKLSWSAVKAALKTYFDTLYATAGGGSSAADAQTFAASGTWTKPAGCTFVRVVCVGGGGGGGGGCGGAAATNRGGGTGGGGGAMIDRIFKASDLPGTVSVTVGAGGTSGAGGSSAAGSTGGNGGTSSFSTYASSYGGGGGTNGQANTSNYSGGGGGGIGGAGGTGGVTSNNGGLPQTASTAGAFGVSGAGANANAGTAGGLAEYGGGAGGGYNGTLQIGGYGGSSIFGAGGGASGGGLSTSNTVGDARTGGAAGSYNGVGGGGTPGATSSAGGAGPAGDSTKCGAGGGGGAANASGTGYAGGAGGAGGGGGGGGGGGTTVGGAGGAGGAGMVRIYSW